jgi:hypothetical protein
MYSASTAFNINRPGAHGFSMTMVISIFSVQSVIETIQLSPACPKRSPAHFMLRYVESFCAFPHMALFVVTLFVLSAMDVLLYHFWNTRAIMKGHNHNFVIQ